MVVEAIEELRSRSMDHKELSLKTSSSGQW